ncbi:MAG: UvrD-helicase domain-containing protein [Thermotaleaceae bacterium]
MIPINYDSMKKKLLNSQFEGGRIMIKGGHASGKTSLAIEKYNHMVEVEQLPSEKILVLLMNTEQCNRWKDSLKLSRSSMIRIQTYSRFVQQELMLYWPLVLQKCPAIENNLLKPQFIPVDTAHFMMKLLVNHFREKKGYLLEVNTPAHQACKLLLSNIRQAAFSRISFEEIGRRLALGGNTKDLIEQNFYQEIDDILRHYMESAIKSGALDEGLSIYMYHEYLLKDKVYLESIRKKIDYIIKDNLEEASPAEIQFMEALMPALEKAYLFYNPEGGTWEHYGADDVYLSKAPFFEGEWLSLESPIDEDRGLVDIALFFKEVLKGENPRKNLQNLPFVLEDGWDLRTEMVEKIGEKIQELLEAGEKPQEICLLMPREDIYFHHELKKLLMTMNLQIWDRTRKEKIIHNCFCHALLVLAVLCFQPPKNPLNLDDYNMFFTKVLQVNPIKGAAAAWEIAHKKELPETLNPFIVQGEELILGRYQRLRAWILGVQERQLSLPDFFRQAYLEVLIELPQARDHVWHVKSFIEKAESFLKSLNSFENMKNPSVKFFDFIKGDIYAYSDGRMKEEENTHILLTTPFDYCANRPAFKYQIWVDVSSSDWSTRSKKELHNPQVLKNTWPLDSLYDEVLEDEKRTAQMLRLFQGLLRKSGGKIYGYGCRYSQRGFVQQSILHDGLVKILGSGGDKDDLS